MQFTKTHEWVEIDGDIATVGISDYAQNALGDIVFVELPQVGDSVTAGEQAIEVESVKAVSEVFSPVTGEVVEINEELLDNPQAVNESCYSAWMMKVRFTATCALMSEKEYLEQLDK